jgi:hypothetical protein
MKLLATALFTGILVVSTAACAKEEPKKAAPVAAAPAAPAAPASSTDAKKDTAPAPETKKVCLDVQGKDGKPVMDPKTNKPKQNCTTVKVREKFEGTKIEDAKKK